MKSPFDFSKVRYLAAKWPPLGAFHGKEEAEQVGSGPQLVAKGLGMLFELCPRLEEFAVVVDERDLEFSREEEFTADNEGRFPDLRGKWNGRLVDATAERCIMGGVITRGRSMLRPKALLRLEAAIREQKLDLRVPRLRLKLFVNDRSPEKLRRWDLFAGTCKLDEGGGNMYHPQENEE